VIRFFETFYNLDRSTIEAEILARMETWP